MSQGDEEDQKGQGLLAPGRVSDVFDHHKQASTIGGSNIRILALVCGVSLLSLSFSTSVQLLRKNELVRLDLIISALSLIVGSYACILESGINCTKALKSNITSHLPSLEQVSGRGILYSVTGLTLFLLGHLFQGLFVAVAGLYMVVVGREAYTCLQNLENAITDEKALMATFQTHDKNGDGLLEIYEFERFINALGIELDNDELDAAFFTIDVNEDRKVAYDEFRNWWKRSIHDLQHSCVVRVPSEESA